jgi:NTP pyrophosphatase (non-canonical NTP hydrolase)
MSLSAKQVIAIEETPFPSMVAALAKPGSAIRDSLDPSRCHLLHMVMGISGESGELLDAIKKYVIYNKSLDITNVIEELGDLEFYLEGLRAELGITREQTLRANKMKLLGKRYASGAYSDDQAITRADKVDAE